MVRGVAADLRPSLSQFVLHALQYPIDSFEEEIQHFYITLGKLDGVLDQAQRLVTLSEREVVDGEVEKELAWDEGNGVGRLTKGGMLPLKVRSDLASPRFPLTGLLTLSLAYFDPAEDPRRAPGHS